jgi:hypothetical protein
MLEMPRCMGSIGDWQSTRDFNATCLNMGLDQHLAQLLRSHELETISFTLTKITDSLCVKQTALFLSKSLPKTHEVIIPANSFL